MISEFIRNMIDLNHGKEYEHDDGRFALLKEPSFEFVRGNAYTITTAACTNVRMVANV